MHLKINCRSTSTAARWLVGICLVSLVAGCSDEEPLGQVAGRVTLDGQPLENAVIMFVPMEGRGSTAYGRTDENGQYSMEFSRSQPGASLGVNKVAITTADQVADGLDRIISLPERIPARYNAQSEEIFDVQAGLNEANFDLISGGSIVQPRDPEDG